MAAVAVLRNETLQAFLQVCAQVSVYFDDFNNLSTYSFEFIYVWVRSLLKLTRVKVELYLDSPVS